MLLQHRPAPIRVQDHVNSADHIDGDRTQNLMELANLGQLLIRSIGG